jgi:hypothetical protein
MALASDYLEQIKTALGDSWLPSLYVERVLKSPSRRYAFPPLPRNPRVEIHHTLLGIELQAGRSRMLCPDLATARYLSIFLRIGCGAAAIPYDITRVSLTADEFESSWQRTLLISDELTASRSSAFRARVRRQIIAKVREEIDQAGSGPRVPQFKQSTKLKTPPKGTKKNVAA